jgi:N-acetylglucosamine-6-phosphate deacetylase
MPNGVLAGSILAQNAALRNLIAFTGCSIEEALTCMTSTPAALLGQENEIGQIAPGFRADFVLMTPELEVVRTFVDGQTPT